MTDFLIKLYMNSLEITLIFTFSKMKSFLLLKIKIMHVLDIEKLLKKKVRNHNVFVFQHQIYGNTLILFVGKTNKKRVRHSYCKSYLGTHYYFGEFSKDIVELFNPYSNFNSS